MRIACLLGRDFEDSEFRVPLERFRAAGHQVTVVGLERGAKLRGKHGKEEATADVGIDEAKPGEFDALFLRETSGRTLA